MQINPLSSYNEVFVLFTIRLQMNQILVKKNHWKRDKVWKIQREIMS